MPGEKVDITRMDQSPDILDLISHMCSTRRMALIIRHRASGYTRRVQSLSDIHHAFRGQWEVAEKVASTPGEIEHRYGTGLPPEAREVKDSRRRFG
jgi:hypothetical protein